MTDNDINSKRNETSEEQKVHFIAFEGHRCVAAGDLTEVARKTKEIMDRGGKDPVFIFDTVTSKLMEVDFRGTVEEVVDRIAQTNTVEQKSMSTEEKRGPGRPRLGVVAREVTLLPRHWDWLNSQPGGASVALRKLVEEARRSHQGQDRARQSQESVYRFMSAMAGDLPGFEEALRAFYAKSYLNMDKMIESWPVDIRNQVRKLLAVAIQNEADAANDSSKS
jgi:hypothetical protein